MIRRHEPTDQEWELLAPLIPRAATGRPRVSDRQVINGMVYKIRTGISWRDLPERYGPWQTVYTRFRRYAQDGVFTHALQHIQACADTAGDTTFSIIIDWGIKPYRGRRPGASLRGHEDGNGDPQAGRTGRSRPRPIPRRPDHQDPPRLRRSRSALVILLTPGQRHDSICARPLLERIRVPRMGLCRPRCRPDHVIADKAYSSRGFRAYLRRRGIAQTIPEKTDQQRHRHNHGRQGGRPPAFDRQIYRQRNIVERCFNRLKDFRGIATRYEKTATSCETPESGPVRIRRCSGCSSSSPSRAGRPVRSRGGAWNYARAIRRPHRMPTGYW
ncbi:IS5 family transposase [Streptomyces sp. NPDC047070]|uniref:IS5 family transposase n=1 Tax=Streptomyces sp. NPDC047070 TaxID=3154923 RepID=UPI00345669C0